MKICADDDGGDGRGGGGDNVGSASNDVGLIQNMYAKNFLFWPGHRSKRSTAKKVFKRRQTTFAID